MYCSADRVILSEIECHDIKGTDITLAAFVHGADGLVCLDDDAVKVDG